MLAGMQQQLMQAIKAALEQLHVIAADFGTVGRHGFQQRFDAVAKVTDRIDPGHARAALERMQVTLQLGQQFAILRRIAQLADDAIAMVEQVLAFLDEDIDQLAVEFVKIQRPRIMPGHPGMRRHCHWRRNVLRQRGRQRRQLDVFDAATDFGLDLGTDPGRWNNDIGTFDGHRRRCFGRICKRHRRCGQRRFGHIRGSPIVADIGQRKAAGRYRDVGRLRRVFDQGDRLGRQLRRPVRGQASHLGCIGLDGFGDDLRAGRRLRCRRCKRRFARIDKLDGRIEGNTRVEGDRRIFLRAAGQLRHEHRLIQADVVATVRGRHRIIADRRHVQQRRIEVDRQILDARKLGTTDDRSFRRIPRRIGRDVRGSVHARVDAGISHVAGIGQAFHQRRPLRFRQGLDQGLQAPGQRRERRNQRRRSAQCRDRCRHCRGNLGHGLHALERRGNGIGQRALDEGFGRSRHRGDLRHIGHGKCATHRVHGAQQAVSHWLRLRARACQPVLDRGQVLADFGLQDLAQHAVHRRRGTGCGRFGRSLPGNAGCDGCRFTDHMEGIFAGGDAIGHILHAKHVGMDMPGTAQRGVELRQYLVGLVDHRHHRRTGRATAIEHAVEHALDLPAELAQGARANQPAAALERVEHAPYRAQALQVVRCRTPDRQQAPEVFQLFIELLDEYLADVLVDLFAAVVEATIHLRGCKCRCRCSPSRSRDLKRGHLRGRRGGLGSQWIKTGCGHVQFGHERGDVRIDLDRRRSLHLLAGGRHGHRWRFHRGRGRRACLCNARFRLRQRGHGSCRSVIDQLPIFGGNRIEGEGIGSTSRNRQCNLVGILRCRRIDRNRRLGRQLQGRIVRHDRGRHVDRRHHRIGGRRLRRFRRDHRGGGRRGRLGMDGFGKQQGAWCGHCRRRYRLDGWRRHRCRYLGGGRHRLPGDRCDRCDGCRCLRRLRGSLRHRPVVQCLEAAAGDVEDLLATRAALAQRLQVVLQAGHCIGQRVELATARHALATNQFHPDVLAHAAQVIGRDRQVEHAQRTGHFIQQAWHVLQPGVVPVGLDEGDEGFARRGEIGDGLVCQYLDRAPGFHRGRILVAILVRAQVCHLVIQRCIDVKQGTGDIQQQVVVDGATACHHFLQRIALLHHHAAGNTQAHHPEGVGNGIEFIYLRLQFARLATHAHVQVQCVLDPQQFFLDRAADGIQQLAVASCQAAAGMLQLGLAGVAGIRIEGEQHAFIDAFGTTRSADLVEQRQQHDRDVTMTVLQPLQVVRQQHGATHQCRAGFIAIRHRAIAHRVGQLFQFLGHHRRCIQFDHAQRSLHLVQVTGTETHAAAVSRVLDEIFDLVASLAQGLVQLRLDPAQRRVAHRIAQGIHRTPPYGIARMPSGRPCFAL